MESEHDFYVYLKDGTELCRMIGLLTKGLVPEGIIFGSNNISALEEENVALFMKIAIGEFPDMQDLFRTKKSEVFSNFRDFNSVLCGLAKLSQKIKKKYKIPDFTCRRKQTHGREEENYKLNDIYDAEEFEELNFSF